MKLQVKILYKIETTKTDNGKKTKPHTREMRDSVNQAVKFDLANCSHLHKLLAPSQSTNQIASFLLAWKKPVLLSRKISNIIAYFCN